eukprot:2296927-Rhodomonas_salina.1
MSEKSKREKTLSDATPTQTYLPLRILQQFLFGQLLHGSLRGTSCHVLAWGQIQLQSPLPKCQVVVLVVVLIVAL